MYSYTVAALLKVTIIIVSVLLAPHIRICDRISENLPSTHMRQIKYNYKYFTKV